MKIPMPMHVGQSLENLIQDISDCGLTKLLFVPQQFIYISFHKLENKIELVFKFDELVQTDNVGMMQFLQNFDLILIFTLIPSRIFFFHMLYCNNLTRVRVYGLYHAPKATITQMIPHLIFFHQEILFNMLVFVFCRYFLYPSILLTEFRL